MLKKIEILERLKQGVGRFFKVCILKNEIKNLVQYSSGGEDYNPPQKIEALGGFISDNPKYGGVFAYKDFIEKKSAPGEKRIYATDAAGNSVVSEIYLKNNGDIVIFASGKVEFMADVKIRGELEADIIKANNGASGEFDKIQTQDGVVVGGS